jgi:hypothetical protein
MNRKEPVEQSGPGRALSFCTKPKHLKTGLGHMALEKAHPAGASGWASSLLLLQALAVAVRYAKARSGLAINCAQLL